MMRKLLLLMVVLLWWPVAAQAAVQLCAISGQVFNPDGTTLNNGTVQFNSQVTQVVGSTTIPPSIISTTTDGSGNMAPMSVAQGLFGQFTFCQGHSSTNVGGPGGGCSAPINGLIPINTTGNIQSVIAGTLLPSVGNATANNLTVTNIANIATLQAGSLAVNNNATVGGTLNVTGATTLGAITAPTMKLTYGDCSALTLAQAIITSNPPDGDFFIGAGMHCNPTPPGGFVADSNSAVMFANYTRTTTTGDHNGGWQWLGATGLTPGNTFTPTVMMALANNAADSAGISTAGILETNSLILQSGATAISMNGAAGSIESSGNPNINITAGGHFDGATWISDSTAVARFSEWYSGRPLITWSVASGQTVGTPTVYQTVGAADGNGWTMYGSNPVAVLSSNTNVNSDILQVVPQNNTLGIGITWQNIHSIGSSPNGNILIDSKGTGYIQLQGNDVGSTVFVDGPLVIQNGYHLVIPNNGNVPSLGTCSAGSIQGLSSDNSGVVSFTAGGATSCTVNFARAWASVPFCICVVTTSGTTGGQCTAGGNTANVTYYFTAVSSGGNVAYHCIGT